MNSYPCLNAKRIFNSRNYFQDKKRLLDMHYKEFISYRCIDGVGGGMYLNNIKVSYHYYCQG